MKFSFPIQLLIALFGTFALAYYPLKLWTNQQFIFTAEIGAIFMTLNAFAGYWAIEKSFHKNNNEFLKYVFGGMALRLFFLGIILLLLVKIFQVHVLALLFSMLFYYIVFTILEIIYIQKKVAAMQHNTQ